MKKIIVVLAVATVVAFALSLVKPDLLSIRDVEGFLSSPASSIQSIADAGSSAAKQAAKEAAQTLADKGSSITDTATTNAVNKAIDASGIKEAAEAELRAREGDIAAATGLDTWTIDYVISSMDIPSWQATTLPDDTYVATSIPFTYSGTDATLTTYGDPGYMTVEAYGQELTFAVPESAQEYIPYLAYVN